MDSGGDPNVTSVSHLATRMYLAAVRYENGQFCSTHEMNSPRSSDALTSISLRPAFMAWVTVSARG